MLSLIKSSKKNSSKERNGRCEWSSYFGMLYVRIEMLLMWCFRHQNSSFIRFYNEWIWMNTDWILNTARSLFPHFDQVSLTMALSRPLLWIIAGVDSYKVNGMYLLSETGYLRSYFSGFKIIHLHIPIFLILLLQFIFDIKSLLIFNII